MFFRRKQLPASSFSHSRSLAAYTGFRGEKFGKFTRLPPVMAYRFVLFLPPLAKNRTESAQCGGGGASSSSTLHTHKVVPSRPYPPLSIGYNPALGP